ncbi:FMN-linked oxidoreductase [Serendipita vermifera]|nr:FMN-linked oxidoreductase [Serendipita vermifera]
MSTLALPKGTAPIKSQYLVDLTLPVEVQKTPQATVNDSPSALIPEGSLSGTVRTREELEAHQDQGTNGTIEEEEDDVEEPPNKRVKLSGAQRKKLAKERNAEKRKNKGQNKGRRFQRIHDEQEICWRLACGLQCDLGEKCRGSHDLLAYLQIKPEDIYIPTAILPSPPFFQDPESLVTMSSDLESPFPECPGAHLYSRCPYYDEYGECRVGFKCRFLGAHLQRTLGDGGKPNLILQKDEAKTQVSGKNAVEMNGVNSDLLKSLRKREYPFKISKRFAEEIRKHDSNSKAVPDAKDVTEEAEEGTKGPPKSTFSKLIDTDDLHRPEKKRLHWKNLTYLAPLTTVGNLPFRRLCTTLGVDITCGEMGLSHSFLQGSKEEWSLVRRHPSERIFGVQIAGNKPEQAASCAEVIGNECHDIDFVDLNAGCPIDLVYQAGSGSALLNMAGKLGKCLMGMNYALGSVPVTMKMRTGVKDGYPTAHKLMPRLHDWGVSSVALHGRTRQQRYTRLADWDYIKSCVNTLRTYEATLTDSDEGMDADVSNREGGRSGNNGFSPLPFWGNGDCFSGIEYWKTVEATGVDGILIGRGALIKPWIFTEIKERRDWDISSRERLDLIRKFAEFGLCHFGTDTPGVNTTRRYLCEALSFMHRYVPIGILEVLPPQINDRAPTFRGRDELETLLARSDSQTWVKISEMFLGPAPPNWNFIPKHKSNAYGGDDATEAQG